MTESQPPSYNQPMSKTTLLVMTTIVVGAVLFAKVGKFPQLQPMDADAREWIRTTIEGMTLEEKVGQLIVAGTKSDFTHVGSERFRVIKENITRYHVGAYHAFGGNALTAARLLYRMQDVATVPLLITADLEGGAGLIFEGGTRFPKAMAIGATFDSKNAYTVAQITALEGRALGIHVNFYPVVDVNNNPSNPIINIRSFGGEPKWVSTMATAYIRGTQEHGMLATAKHFPGHGDTATDSHLELPVIHASRERMNQIELPPFRAAIQAGVEAIMTAHLYIPALEPHQRVPATLSRRILTGLLREEMGFNGLIFTDAMTMQGISAHYSPEEAAVRAFQAGADLILYSPSVKAAFQGLLHAVRKDIISEERLNFSLHRILTAKARLNLHKISRGNLLDGDQFVGSQQHQDLAQDVMDRAVTLVRNKGGVLPFSLPKDACVLLLILMDSRYRGDQRGDKLVSEFQNRHPKTFHFEVGADTSTKQRRLLQELAKQMDYLVVGAYIRIRAYKDSIHLSYAQIQLLKALSRLDRPFAFVLFGSPYLLSSVPELPTYILTYEDYPGAEIAAVKTIVGEIPFRGKLPVRLPDFYPIGHGILK